jgi:hypothetical protein
MIEVTLATFISRRCIKCRAKDELVHKITQVTYDVVVGENKRAAAGRSDHANGALLS